MIDNLAQVERLIEKLRAALPVAAFAGPELLSTLRAKAPEATITPRCMVTEVVYTGDDGGILCHLVFDDEPQADAFLVSITHLAFDPRLPVARAIGAYQKHRIKRLRHDRRANAGSFEE